MAERLVTLLIGGPGGSGHVGTFRYRGEVATAAVLPTTGNSPGDAMTTTAGHHIHVWDGTAWIDQGTITSGPAGADGPRGNPGPAGAKGDTGPPGPTGLRGDLGPKGDRGDPGLIGNPGPVGATGGTGPKGDTGPGGARGPVGAAGAAFKMQHAVLDRAALPAVPGVDGALWFTTSDRHMWLFDPASGLAAVGVAGIADGWVDLGALATGVTIELAAGSLAVGPVTVSDAHEGQILAYDATAGEWRNRWDPLGSVWIDQAKLGDILRYDGTRWRNSRELVNDIIEVKADIQRLRLLWSASNPTPPTTIAFGYNSFADSGLRIEYGDVVHHFADDYAHPVFLIPIATGYKSNMWLIRSDINIGDAVVVKECTDTWLMWNTAGLQEMGNLVGKTGKRLTAENLPEFVAAMQTSSAYATADPTLAQCVGEYKYAYFIQCPTENGPRFYWRDVNKGGMLATITSTAGGKLVIGVPTP